MAVPAVAGDEPAEFVALMRRQGVAQAWVESFDGLLHKDVAAVNARLASDCRTDGDGLLVPFGSVNPALPDWQKDVHCWREQHRMPGIRLHPNYRGYALGDLRRPEVPRLAERSGLIVQLVAAMEDERTQHSLLGVLSEDLRPLALIVPAIPAVPLVIPRSPRPDRSISILRWWKGCEEARRWPGRSPRSVSFSARNYSHAISEGNARRLLAERKQ